MKVSKLLLSLLLVLTVLLSACGDKKRTRTPSDPDPEVVVEVDGIAFTATNEDGVVAKTIIYDDYLKGVLNDTVDIEDLDESINGFTPTYYRARFDLTLSNVIYDEETIATIKCSEDNANQLYFKGISSANVLLNEIEIPVGNNITMNCAGSDGDSYYATIYKSVGFDQDSFALYFDFIQLTIRGRINIQRVGDKMPTGLHFD